MDTTPWDNTQKEKALLGAIWAKWDKKQNVKHKPAAAVVSVSATASAPESTPELPS